MRCTIQQLLSQPLAIAPGALPGLFDEARAELKGSPAGVQDPVVACEYFAIDGRPAAQQGKRQPGSLVAVVHLSGPLSRHGYAGFFSSSPGTLATSRTLQTLDRDESVAGIVLAIDSPGGAVVGTSEAAAVVRQIRDAGNTRIVSVADAMACSAACWIASAAEATYAIGSATLASIGVLSTYADYSRALEKSGVDVHIARTPELKARFSGLEPLTDAMKETLERTITTAYGEFVDALASNRGVSTKHVEKHFGRGETLTTKESLSVGLIDGAVSSVDEVVAMLMRETTTRR
jgi:signal peptide peptidase SppA